VWLSRLPVGLGRRTVACCAEGLLKGCGCIGGSVGWRRIAAGLLRIASGGVGLFATHPYITKH